MPSKSPAWQIILLRHANATKARDPWHVVRAIDVGRPEFVGLGPDTPETMRRFLNTMTYPGSPWYICVQFVDEPWLYFLPSRADLVSPQCLARCSELNVLAAGYRPEADLTWLELYKRGHQVVSFSALGRGDQPLRIQRFDSREHGKRFLKGYTTTDDALSALFDSFKSRFRRIAAVENNGAIQLLNHDHSSMDESQVHTLTLQFLVPLTAGENPAGSKLAAAIERGDAAAVREAIAEGASLERLPDTPVSPLTFAADPKNTGDWKGICEALIEAGAPVDGYGWEDPLICNAVDEFRDDRANIEFVKAVLAWGANINSTARLLNSGATPLHLAVLKGRLAMTKFLVSQGARLDVRDSEGRTALESAEMLVQNCISRDSTTFAAIADFLRHASNGSVDAMDIDELGRFRR